MLASNGDHRLGGKDWDDVIVNWVADEFDEVHGENPLLDLQQTVNFRILDEFRRLGIEFDYPTQRIVLTRQRIADKLS